jgi:lipid-A-disaccharide synthase-like uncharacterized protein
MSAFAVLGWVGNAAFFVRFLVQWWASERARRSVAPASFWWVSLAGSAALGAYSLHRGEPVLVAGYAVNAAIYARNLRLGRRSAGALSPAWVSACALLLVVLLFASGAARARGDWAAAPGWLACVLVGQGLWSSRFVVQWWSSERTGESHFPLAFWWISLTGNALLLSYALHLRDPVYVAGFAVGPLVQVRNLMLSPRKARRQIGRNSGGVPE